VLLVVALLAGMLVGMLVGAAGVVDTPIKSTNVFMAF
jgi:hypothetical protein